MVDNNPNERQPPFQMGTRGARRPRTVVGIFGKVGKVAARNQGDSRKVRALLAIASWHVLVPGINF
jgi:hypothetical protein